MVLPPSGSQNSSVRGIGGSIGLYVAVRRATGHSLTLRRLYRPSSSLFWCSSTPSTYRQKELVPSGQSCTQNPGLAHTYPLTRSMGLDVFSTRILNDHHITSRVQTAINDWLASEHESGYPLSCNIIPSITDKPSAFLITMVKDEY